MNFYRNDQIEQIAERRLVEFQQKLGRPLSFPLDIELFGDLVLGLSMLWEEIEEMPGEEVLAGLRASDRLIVMNERRKDEMEQMPGRRRLDARSQDGTLGSVRRYLQARSSRLVRRRSFGDVCLP
jgi:hypothetical protein